MKNILVILGHPDEDSFCNALAQAYVDGAKQTGATVTLLRLSKLSFDPILRHGYRMEQPLEPDLQRAQQLVKDADHLVWVYPNWWATVPALLKGFIDRVFLPNFAFAYPSQGSIPKKLLGGKTARLIVTADSPKWYYHLLVGAPGHKMMKTGVLEFSGVRPVKITGIASVRSLSKQARNQWKNKVTQLGKNHL